MSLKEITIKKASVHNLKSINVKIPKNSLTVVTGPSGSGKSSLAFDTIYVEGQRRYIESLSSYARQFLGQYRPADVESISLQVERYGLDGLETAGRRFWVNYQEDDTESTVMYVFGKTPDGYRLIEINLAG